MTALLVHIVTTDLAQKGQKGPLFIWLTHGESMLVAGGWLSWGSQLEDLFPVLLELSTELRGLGLSRMD